MARDVTLNNMVRLPRLNASSATALAEQLLTAAAAESARLPLLLERQRVRLEAARTSTTMRRRSPPPSDLFDYPALPA